MALPDPERWSQISALLDNVLEVPPEERAAYLDEACADDPELRREVEAFLDAEANAPDFLEGEAAHHASAFMPDVSSSTSPDPLSPGQQLGAYRVAEKIGEGGMSTIYRAERADGSFEQDVAIKLMRTDFGTGDFVQRFLNERQILASLNHPNIARVFDGGTTDTGRPYFVMEHVEGTPITTYCDEHRLSIEERLALFQTVAEAVQHAHQNLVVHRDLKPSNILVTEAGQVKLLDFGIAKLLSPDPETSPPEAPVTRTGLHLMTPEYAAPEQVKGETITTTTDIYALGILLYELLTGHRPYHLQQRSPYEIVRAICDEEPTRPSTIVTKVREGTSTRITPDDVSTARGLDADALQRTLSGDLDAIVLKALRKPPADRYATVEAFTDDIRRYLADEPVDARANTWTYRTRKFARRHWLGVATVAAVALLIAGFMATLVYQQTVTAQARTEAEAEATKANQVAQFMVELFESNDPTKASADTLTARTLLQRGVERAQGLDDQPAVQVHLLNTIGEAYREMGQYDSAQAVMERALTLSEQTFDAPHPTHATTQVKLGMLLRDSGAYDEADSLLQGSLDQLQQLPDMDSLRAEALYSRAMLKQTQNELDSSVDLHWHALRIRLTLHDFTHSDVLTSMHGLASTLHDQSKYEEAETFYQWALEGFANQHGIDHPFVGAVLNNLAFLKSDQGQLAEAETLYRQALTVRRERLGADHPEVATTLNNLGALFNKRANYAAAESTYQAALSIWRDRLGDDHVRTAVTQGNLARTLFFQGAYEAADSLYQKTLAVDRAQLGDDHHFVGIDLHNLARLKHAQGAYEEADSLFEEALAIFDEALPSDHPRTATSIVSQGELFMDWNRLDTAETRLREGLRMRMATLDPSHWEIAEAQSSLGACLTRQGRYATADSLLQEALTTLRLQTAPPPRPLRKTIDRLIALHEARDAPEEAARYRKLRARTPHLAEALPPD